MEQGSTKSFSTGDTTGLVGEMMSVRIIGVCQDVKEDGTMAGLTFQTTHALKSPGAMNYGYSSAGGWGSTLMRSLLNGSVYSVLPSDLRSSIVSVKKYYSSQDGTSTDESSITYTLDKMFLLSPRELYGYSDSTVTCYAFEGTGVGHNEQYQFYAGEGVALSNVSLLNNMYMDYDMKPPNDSIRWWFLRSIYHKSGSGNFWGIDWMGGCSGNSADNLEGIVPAFCF
jgi:hypothetical protein